MFRLILDLFSSKPRVYNIVTFHFGEYYTTEGVEWHRDARVPLTLLKTLALYLKYYRKLDNVYILRDWSSGDITPYSLLDSGVGHTYKRNKK